MLEKENLELVGCTFHPKILQSPQSESGCNSSRIYGNRNALRMMNNSQASLGANGDAGYCSGSRGLDINNLAQNIASELLKNQSYNATVNLVNSKN